MKITDRNHNNTKAREGPVAFVAKQTAAVDHRRHENLKEVFHQTNTERDKAHTPPTDKTSYAQ